jgi:hypothetical protein
VENLRVADQLKVPGVDERMILKQLLKEIVCEGANWIKLAQGYDPVLEFCEQTNEP